MVAGLSLSMPWSYPMCSTRPPSSMSPGGRCRAQLSYFLLLVPLFCRIPLPFIVPLFLLGLREGVPVRPRVLVLVLIFVLLIPCLANGLICSSFLSWSLLPTAWRNSFSFFCFSLLVPHLALIVPSSIFLGRWPTGFSTRLSGCVLSVMMFHCLAFVRLPVNLFGICFFTVLFLLVSSRGFNLSFFALRLCLLPYWFVMLCLDFLVMSFVSSLAFLCISSTSVSFVFCGLTTTIFSAVFLRLLSRHGSC